MNRLERPTDQPVTIANGASLSGAIQLSRGVRQLAGIAMPAAWTAASITFLVSFDDITYQQLYYGAGVYTINAAAGAAAGLSFSVDPNAFAGWPYVKVQSGTAASPTVQLAARVLTCMIRAT